MTDAPSSTKHPIMTRAASRTAKRPVSIIKPTNPTAITHKAVATVPIRVPVSQSAAEDRTGVAGASNRDGASDMSVLRRNEAVLHEHAAPRSRFGMIAILTGDTSSG